MSSKVCQNILDLKVDGMLSLFLHLAYAFLFCKREALPYSVCNVNLESYAHGSKYRGWPDCFKIVCPYAWMFLFVLYGSLLL